MNRQISGRESLELDPNTYGNLVYNKGSFSNHWGKDGVFSKWCLDNWVDN